jgi:MOSC domain-containing protein YiiM
VAGIEQVLSSGADVKILSLNTGRPREIEWNGQIVRTSIWKSPRQGRVRVTTLNFDGDEQSDLSVHGGKTKAVYVYPSEHYEFWRRELPGVEMPWGTFGENLTTEGVLETDVNIGDRIGIGSAEFLVTQPRLPCFKLGIRFGRDDIVKRFMASGRSGFYVAVVREGDAAVGDRIAFVHHAADSLTVSAIAALRRNDEGQQDLLSRAAEMPALPGGWRDYFRKRLRTGNSS